MSCCSRILGRVGVFASLVAACSAFAAEADNYAPIFTIGRDSTFLAVRNRALGPFYENDIDGAYEVYAKIRPLYAEGFDSTTDTGWSSVLYPFYIYRDFPGGHRWAFFELINGSETVSTRGEPIESFEIWPIYWHYDNGVRKESYDAVFPIAGTLRNRMFYKRIDWFGFPAFVRLEQADHVDTCILWPVFRSRLGPQTSGFGVWPLAGHFEKTGSYNRTYFIWPLGYNNHKTLPDNQGGGDLHQTGLLPLYAQETAPGLVSRTYLWPFFGYTTQTAPRPNYHEVRFFYPFGVEGRGDKAYVNRLLPVYAHETHPGYDKHWYAWPIYRHVDSRQDSLDISKDSVLYFVYQNEVQTAPGHNFEARKTQLWPLFGYSDDGKNSRQFQFLNPFEPLYGSNEQIRQIWTPFFAIYRYEERGDELRHSVLWDLFLYDREADKSDFSIGPLFERKKSADASSWNVAKGLIGRETVGGKSRWSVLWGIFGRKGGK
jgi:hypothetical protein